MKSLIKEVMAKAESRAAAEQRIPPPVQTEEDRELEEVLKSLRTRIVIVGLGGAGSNTINRMMQEGITGADLIAANTDAQHLLTIRAQKKILLGKRTTRGLGAGAVPAIGEKAAKEAEDELKAVLQGADMVFVTCGLGGGSGTGSAPFVAQLAKETGALTIAVATLPFKAEGIARMKNAQWGLERLRRVADTVIVMEDYRPRDATREAKELAKAIRVHGSRAYRRPRRRVISHVEELRKPRARAWMLTARNLESPLPLSNDIHLVEEAQLNTLAAVASMTRDMKGLPLVEAARRSEELLLEDPGRLGTSPGYAEVRLLDIVFLLNRLPVLQARPLD